MSADRGAPSGTALPCGRTVRYRLTQSFTYAYDGPVRDLTHRLVVVPPAVHGDQVRRSGTVTVSDPTARVSWHGDDFGNRHCVVRLARVPHELTLAVDVVVDRGAAPLLASAPSPSRGPARAAVLRAASALTEPDAALRALASSCVVPGDTPATVEAVGAAVRERVAYGFGATDVTTTAAQALAAGTGVCQDQAHVMLAALRALGIASRYVSGHLVGQGGTHAWTEVLLPGRRVLAYDPCHARRTDSRYVTVAVGRDYRDVPPTSGSYAGGARGTLTGERLLATEPVAA